MLCVIFKGKFYFFTVKRMPFTAMILLLVYIEKNAALDLLIKKVGEKTIPLKKHQQAKAQIFKD